MSDEVQWALLAADTDRTQDYVFESARLPEIRGASRHLDDLNEDIGRLAENRGGEVILCGGGGLLAKVPQQVAASLAREIEAIYPHETSVATITADWRPITQEMLDVDDPKNPSAHFGSLLQWAGTWLRRRKESRESVPFLESLPYVERCRSCQIRPAHTAYLEVYPDWPLCRICHDKRDYRGRDLWFRDFQTYLDRNPKLRDHYYQGGEPFRRFDAEREQARWTPQDLGEIGEACSARKGYVGFIYLDGDEMGHAFEKVPTPEACRSLSNAVGKAAREAVMTALGLLHPAWVHPSPVRRSVDEQPEPEQLDAHGRMRIHPFDIITVGGDDVMLIVPADQAVPVACTISQKFQEMVQVRMAQEDALQELRDHPYTMSGGLVIASDHNPVRVLRDLASELKDIAKRECKRDKAKRESEQDKARRECKQDKAEEGYVDFLVLKSADMVERNVRQMRNRYPYLVEAPGTRPLNLLGRPYPVSVLGTLWREVGALREKARFPNSQMNQLAESLLQGRRESTLFYLYQRARDKRGYFAHIDRLLLEVQGSEARDPIPWVDLSGTDTRYSFQTVLWDVAELYGFVPGDPVLREESND